jgi:hypothetical protein
MNRYYYYTNLTNLLLGGSSSSSEENPNLPIATPISREDENISQVDIPVATDVYILSPNRIPEVVMDQLRLEYTDLVESIPDYQFPIQQRLNGTRYIMANTFNNYDIPIPTYQNELYKRI